MCVSIVCSDGLPGIRVQIQDVWPDSQQPQLDFDNAAKLLSTLMASLGNQSLSNTLRERSVEMAEERIMGMTYADKQTRQVAFRQLYARLALRLATAQGYGFCAVIAHLPVSSSFSPCYQMCVFVCGSPLHPCDVFRADISRHQ
jgi:hypothetical protein